MTDHKSPPSNELVAIPYRPRTKPWLARILGSFGVRDRGKSDALFTWDDESLPHRRPTITFGGVEHQLDWAKLHFGAVGAPRSGKTLSLQQLASSALRTMMLGDTKRAFFWDFKSEWERWLRSFVPDRKLRVISPFDPAAVAWDIAADIHNVDEAAAIGKLLAPVYPNEREPFFSEMVAALISGALISWHMSGRAFDLEDALKSLSSRKGILECLEAAPEENRFRIEHYLKSKQMNRDVMATLANRLEGLSAVGRHWRRARERVSVGEWMAGKFVLVLGHSHTHASATQAIMRAVFERMYQYLLDGPDIDRPESWVFLDELPSAGRLDHLPDLLSKGPSKGVVVATGFQDIGSMRNIYTPDVFQSINSYLQHKIFGRIADPDTAEWASRHFGEQDIIRTLTTRSWTDGAHPSSTVAVGEHLEKRRVVRPEWFMNIPPLSPPRVASLGLYVISPYLGNYRYDLPLEEIERISPRIPATKVLLLPPPPPALASPKDQPGGGKAEELQDNENDEQTKHEDRVDDDGDDDEGLPYLVK